jgi:hypothetical protein
VVDDHAILCGGYAACGGAMLTLVVSMPGVRVGPDGMLKLAMLA